MLDVTVALKALRESAEALRSLSQVRADAHERAKDVREAKRLLGLADPVGEAYRSDAVHPLYMPGHLHPDNKAALVAAGFDVLAKGAAAREKLQVDATDSSLLLFGSPTSEGLSRVIFDYTELPDRDGLSLIDPPLDFPYAWELDPEKVGDGRVGRLVKGKGLVERPPWQIKGRSTRLVPETDSEGLISEDYLLITRMRNFLSPDAEGEGKFLVSFGGAHGTGTRAVGLLLSDKRLMQRVLEELKRSHMSSSGQLGGVPKAYQLLFRVSRIKHRRSESVPGALELVDAVSLPDDETTWDLARRRVTSRLEASTPLPPPPSDE